LRLSLQSNLGNIMKPMQRLAFLLLAVLLLGLGAGVGEAVAAGKQQARKGAGEFETAVLPLLKTYCFDCHGDGARKGDLSLDPYTNLGTVRADRKTWEHILQNVRSAQMPPPKKKAQPTPAERERLVQWIEDELFPVDCNNPDPGRVTLRRLNRTEYNNTIRDLVGVDFHPADDFPQDDVGYGFDNIGDVLSMPPVLLEKYMAAADAILEEALVTEDPTVRRTTRLEPDQIEATTQVESRNNSWFAVTKEGDVHSRVKFRATGEYILRVRAAGEQAGPDPVKMALAVDDRDLATIVVPEQRKEAKVHEARFTVDRGAHKVAVRYLNNYFNAKEPDPKKRDRNLLLQWIEIEGPFNPGPQTLPETHRRIFVREPGRGDGRSAAREILQRFARRAWRRPVEGVEISRLLALYDLARKEGETFEKAVRVGLQATLVSPHFLFRGELQPDPDNPQKVRPVDEFAMASRLSYFLWSTMPDEELFRLAESGRLRRNLDAQVARMLRDPRARALVDNFVAQWLQIRNLEVVNPDRKLFPAFSDDLRRDMARETTLFAEHILREDRSVLEFIDSDYTFLNERLARVYGIEGVTGAEFRRVALQDHRRGGVLTQGSILTITSNPTRTSPVKRGKWVMETLLGTPPPPPPPNAPPLQIDPEHPLKGTLRQRMEQHRANPACASCHEGMDAIGFGLENYDAVGGWRTSETGVTIDPSGKLSTGDAFQGPVDLKQILTSQRRADFLRCLTEKMLTYALGRGIEYYDRCAVERIQARLERENYRFSSLVRGIVESVPFQRRRGEGERQLQVSR
jgi:mono/diheme cytochrome c family protein